MGLYDLPKFELPRLEKSKTKGLKFWQNRVFWTIILTIFHSSVFGFLAGALSGSFFYLEVKNYLANLNIELPEVQKIIEREYVPQTSQEESIIKTVEEAASAVVSIIITKDIPIFFLTAKTDPLSRHAGKLTAEEFIEKPFDAEKLQKSVKKSLG